MLIKKPAAVRPLVGWALPTIPYRLAHVAQTTIKADIVIELFVNRYEFGIAV